MGIAFRQRQKISLIRPNGPAWPDSVRHADRIQFTIFERRQESLRRLRVSRVGATAVTRPDVALSHRAAGSVLEGNAERWLRDEPCGFFKCKRKDELAALWADHADRIVAEHVADYPCSRPRRRWEYSAPSPIGEAESEAAYLDRHGLFLPGERKRLDMADSDRRVRTRAYSAAVLAVELAMASARSPALTARQKVRLLGKQQVDHWTPSYARPATAE
jgi:hypothetical protein